MITSILCWSGHFSWTHSSDRYLQQHLQPCNILLVFKMNKIFFFPPASVTPKGHLSPCDHAGKIPWQALHILRCIYVGVNLLILENTLSERTHIYPEVNVILWRLSCNHQSLAGPEFNTNTSNQLRGTVCNFWCSSIWYIYMGEWQLCVKGWPCLN